MPGPEHEALGGTLFREIERKIEDIPGHVYAFCSVGATRFEGTIDNRNKEADFALQPATRVERTSWPSLVIEVGYSQRLDDLHADAAWWLRNSQGRTRFVIIAKISRDPFTLHIECWKWGCPDIGGDAALWIPKCVQDFDVNEDGEVTSPLASPELRIPYDSIFDISSSTISNVIVLSFPELSHLAVRVFRLLQLPVILPP